jgi:hypothetical protein
MVLFYSGLFGRVVVMVVSGHDFKDALMAKILMLIPSP